MKRFLLLFAALVITGALMAQTSKMNQVSRSSIRPADHGLNQLHDAVRCAEPLKAQGMADGPLSLQKISMSSSLNCNGIMVYDQRFLTYQPVAGMVTYGNRAGGPFGNTGNDLKFKFTTDQGTTWDSVLILSTGVYKFRYPSMIVYNPGGSTNPHDMFGIATGPIYGATDWSDQFFGSVRLDGQHLDMNYEPIEPGTYLNHMHTDLYCSPDGHITVSSQRMNGGTSAYTYHGWEVLNGVFNTATSKVDWQLPYLKVLPDLLEEGRIDAHRVVWSPDGSVGYLLGIATDADLAYNPYGVGWPVIYKTTDHGLNWVKEAPFDYSTISLFQEYLFPTRMDTTLVIPRWYNKYVGGNRQNGATVDLNGNLHIFGQVRGTMSVNPDSIDYFYTLEPALIFDVYMKQGGGWDAYFIDSLTSAVTPDPGTYGISWDHQMQITRNADGSKFFCLWTDTEPIFGEENTNPDIKGVGIDVVNGLATPVKNFTQSSLYWGENFWMRVADQVSYNVSAHESTLPVTTSIPGATNEDPLTHQYFLGLTVNDDEFELPVGIPEPGAGRKGAVVINCYPNPFRDATAITINLQEAATVTLTLTTAAGRSVKQIDEGLVQAGSHRIAIDGSSLLPGLYLCTVKVNGVTYVNKMVVQ